MSTLAIYEFLFDYGNEEEFAVHGVSSVEVLQVLGNRYLIQPNRRARRGAFLVIGTTDGGSCLAIPIKPTHDREIWRPMTAWPCKRSGIAKLRKAQGGRRV